MSHRYHVDQLKAMLLGGRMGRVKRVIELMSEHVEARMEAEDADGDGSAVSDHSCTCRRPLTRGHHDCYVMFWPDGVLLLWSHPEIVHIYGDFEARAPPGAASAREPPAAVIERPHHPLLRLPLSRYSTCRATCWGQQKGRGRTHDADPPRTYTGHAVTATA
jgi:hypothetical protein